VEKAFLHVGITIQWSGERTTVVEAIVVEVGVPTILSFGEDRSEILTPTEVDVFLGGRTKAKEGWGGLLQRRLRWQSEIQLPQTTTVVVFFQWDVTAKSTTSFCSTFSMILPRECHGRISLVQATTNLFGV